MLQPDSNQSAGTQDIKSSLGNIYNEPYTKHALDLAEAFAKKTLAGDGLFAYLDSLPAEEAAEERAKLEQFLTNGNPDVSIDLSSRAGQLVWTAGLGHVFQSSPPGTIRNSPIWRALTSHSQISASLATAARFVDLAVANRDTTMGWGAPGSGFHFSFEENHINIDLFNALLLGFSKPPAPGMIALPHATGAMMHEVGHSQLSIRFTDGMLALKDRETQLEEQKSELGERVKGREPTKEESEEYSNINVELRRVRAEFNLRHGIWNAVEDNCVNQYAVNQSRELPYDFGASLNYLNVLYQGTGMRLKWNEQGRKEQIPDNLNEKQKKIYEAQKKLETLKMAIFMSFYATNGLFDRDDMGVWKELGVDTESIKIIAGENKPASAADHFLNGGQRSDFQKLIDLNIGPNGAAWQQPHTRDRQLLTSIFMRNISVYADRRAEIIDEIWDKYFAPYADVLLDAAEEEHQHQKNNKNNQDKSSDKEEQSQPGESDSGEGQEQQQGENQAGGNENKDTESSPSQSSGEGSGEEQGQGKSQGHGQPDEQSSQQGSAQGGGSAEKPQENHPPQNPQNSGADDSKNEEGSKRKMDEEAGDSGGFEEDDAGETLPSSPQDPGHGGCQNQGCNTDQEPEHEDDAADAKNAQKVRDLAEEAKKQEQSQQQQSNGAGNENESDGQESPGSDSSSSGNGQGGGNSAQGGDGQGVDLSALAAKADWTHWSREIAKLEPLIRRVAKDFQYIRERQKHLERNLSRNRREVLPRGNNMHERFDMDAHMRLTIKNATGQRIEEPDLRRWKMDDVQTETTSVELWILTDGSQSMEWKLPTGGRAIDSAVQGMAVLFEGGRRADFDVFAGMWGDGKIRMLAQPDDRDQNIGKNFQGAKNGIGSGTKLSPAFHQAIQHSAKQVIGKDGQRKRYAGMTHFLILSDGDLEQKDVEPTVEMMKLLFKQGPDVSIDIAIFPNGSAQKRMESVVEKVKQAVPGAAISIIRVTDAKKAPLILAKQIRRRFERSEREVKATPDERKREAFSKVDRSILNADL